MVQDGADWDCFAYIHQPMNAPGGLEAALECLAWISRNNETRILHDRLFRRLKLQSDMVISKYFHSPRERSKE